MSVSVSYLHSRIQIQNSEAAYFRAKGSNKMRRKSLRCKHGDGVDQPLNAKKDGNGKKKLKILIAGGGIGGLVLALAAKHRGFEVQVFEKELSSVRGEGQHRGPIQLVSSALAVVEAIDENVAKQIKEAGCVTGNRKNGFVDGVSGDWFTKFDLRSPAVSRGLPITQVICRMELQRILLNAVGLDIVKNNSKVVDFIQDPTKVTAILEDGQRYDGDVLVGADGIWSKVRSKLFGRHEAKYSNYTCYSGVTESVPPYVDSVGYRVFLGLNHYFAAIDVGNGNVQWFGFHKHPPTSTDPPSPGGGKKKRVLEIFGKWCGEVVTLIKETPEPTIIQRDIYDRDMLYSWGTGRVALLGDAAHPLQPNFGQGGCMAIEDCYQIIDELVQVPNTGSDAQMSDEISLALKRYATKRIRRVGVVHAATRMTTQLLCVYYPWIEFKNGPLPHLRIKNPAFPVARAFLRFWLPELMAWMIAGHGLRLKGKEMDANYRMNTKSAR